MDLIIHAIFDTEWGIILVGAFLLGACLFEFFNHKNPKI